MCDICHKMWQLGWVASNDGNVSAKLEDGNFLVTPTGISKSLITPEKLLIITKNCEIIEGAPDYKPSSEIKMHLRCYQDRDDVGAVVHAHPPAATAFAVAHLPMDRYTTIESVITIGSVPLTPYGTPSTNEVPEAIAPYLPEHDVLLRMETLELSAKISIYAHILGGEKEISRENIDRLCRMRADYKVWGKHPGYKHYRKDD